MKWPGSITTTALGWLASTAMMTTDLGSLYLALPVGLVLAVGGIRELMSIKSCGGCGADVDVRAGYCPKCGGSGFWYFAA